MFRYHRVQEADILSVLDQAPTLHRISVSPSLPVTEGVKGRA